MLIVEDGTLVEGANSYGEVFDADIFFADRGITEWDGSGIEKEGWMIQAADYLNGAFMWKGVSVDHAQSMALPTDEIYEIPQAVKTAQFLLALEAKRGTLSTTALGERLVASERKKLDGLGEKEVTYVDGPAEFATKGSLILGLLSPFIRTRVGNGIQTARIVYS